MPRREHAPELSYDERITGTGTISRGGFAIPVIRYSLTRRRYDVESEWEFHASVEDPMDRRWNALLASGPGVPSFEGTDDNGIPVVIKMLYFKRQSGRDFEATAQTVAVGHARISGEIGVPHIDRQYVSIDLWPSPLAEPEVFLPAQYWTGEIKAHRGRKRDAPTKVWVRLAGHRFRFSQVYVWDEAIVSGQRSLVRIPVTRLSGQIHTRRRTGDIETLFGQIVSELEDLNRLLTLLSRRHVRWSRIEIATQWRSRESGRYDTYAVVQGSRSSHRNRGASPLLVPGRMPADWLEKLLRNYRELTSNNDGVAAAVIYLIAAHDSAFVDGAVTNAYTAFEASLNALSSPASEFTLASGAFGKLASQVRDVIRGFAESRDLPPDVVDAIRKKVPELRRRPITDRVLEYVTSSNINVAGLWPPDLPLEAGLRALFKRRNDFVHAGKLGEIHQAGVDAERLILLTEKLLLRALQVEDEWIHPRAMSATSQLELTPEPAGE